MPTYTKQFGRPKYYDHEILKMDGAKIGTLRIKPTGVLWKPKNVREFYSVSLDQFIQWITGKESGARRTGS